MPLPSPQRATSIFRALPFYTTPLFDVADLLELADETELTNHLGLLRDEETRDCSNPNAPFAMFTAAMKGERLTQKETIAMAFPTVMRHRIIYIALFNDGKAPLRSPTLCRELRDVKLPTLSKLPVDKFVDMKSFIRRANDAIASNMDPVVTDFENPVITLSSERLFTSICKRSKGHETPQPHSHCGAENEAGNGEVESGGEGKEAENESGNREVESDNEIEEAENGSGNGEIESGSTMENQREEAENGPGNGEDEYNSGREESDSRKGSGKDKSSSEREDNGEVESSSEGEEDENEPGNGEVESGNELEEAENGPGNGEDESGSEREESNSRKDSGKDKSGSGRDGRKDSWNDKSGSGREEFKSRKNKSSNVREESNDGGKGIHSSGKGQPGMDKRKPGKDKLKIRIRGTSEQGNFDEARIDEVQSEDDDIEFLGTAKPTSVVLRDQVKLSDLSFPDSERQRKKLPRLDIHNGSVVGKTFFILSILQVDRTQRDEDQIAWDDAGGHGNENYPINDVRWSLAATEWAQHKWHVDWDGFATFTKVETGTKIWSLGTPKRDLSPSLLSGGIERILGNFDFDRVNSDILDIEAVVLTPNDLL
ncbi:hypothetical protein C0993_007461, partial [Termitomyces sp. T159_Od127]